MLLTLDAHHKQEPLAENPPVQENPPVPKNPPIPENLQNAENQPNPGNLPAQPATAGIDDDVTVGHYRIC